MATAGTGPLIPRRRLGSAFRELREARGETLQQTARALMFSSSKLSRVENGLGGEPHPRDVRDLIAHFGLRDAEQIAELEQIAADGRKPGWWQTGRYQMPAKLDTFISYENAAASIAAYLPTVVPGLLQTRAYATEIFRRLAPQLTDAERSQQVDLRMDRQRALADREPPATLLLIFPETVLRRTIGTDATMREQLGRLADTFDDPRTDVQVVPFTAGVHPAMEGGFTIFRFEDPHDPPVAALETVSSIQFVDQEDQVAEHEDALHDLQQYTLDRPASRAFIERLRDGDDIWRTT